MLCFDLQTIMMSQTVSSVIRLSCSEAVSELIPLLYDVWRLSDMIGSYERLMITRGGILVNGLPWL